MMLEINQLYEYYKLFLIQVGENLEASGIDFKGYPMAEILLCCGFFLIYLIEELVHFFLDSDVHEHHEETIRAHRYVPIELPYFKPFLIYGI